MGVIVNDPTVDMVKFFPFHMVNTCKYHKFPYGKTSQYEDRVSYMSTWFSRRKFWLPSSNSRLFEFQESRWDVVWEDWWFCRASHVGRPHGLCGKIKGALLDLGGGNSNIFFFHPYLGKISNLTNIFQLG